KVIGGINPVHRAVEADPAVDGLAAPSLVGTADEDVVDPSVGLAKIAGERVALAERGSLAVTHQAECIGEVNASRSERAEAGHEANFVGVGRGIEVTDDHRRKTGDGGQLSDALGDDFDLRFAYVSLAEAPAEVGDEKGKLAERRIELGEDETP